MLADALVRGNGELSVREPKGRKVRRRPIGPLLIAVVAIVIAGFLVFVLIRVNW